MQINHKVILKWKRTHCLAVEHQIAELQITTPLQTSATKFYNRADISSRFDLKLVSGTFGRYILVLVL